MTFFGWPSLSYWQWPSHSPSSSRFSTSIRGTLLALARAWREWEGQHGLEDTYRDELLVLGVTTIFGQHAENGLLAVKTFADLVQALDKSYSKEGSVQSMMPSILVQIEYISSQGHALVLTVVRLGLFDHTLDGIFDVVGLFLFDRLLLGHFVPRLNHQLDQEA